MGILSHIYQKKKRTGEIYTWRTCTLHDTSGVMCVEIAFWVNSVAFRGERLCQCIREIYLRFSIRLLYFRFWVTIINTACACKMCILPQSLSMVGVLHIFTQSEYFMVEFIFFFGDFGNIQLFWQNINDNLFIESYQTNMYYIFTTSKRQLCTLHRHHFFYVSHINEHLFGM